MVVDVLVWIFGTMFAVAALLAVIRIIRGPSIIDRMVASDALFVHPDYRGGSTGARLILEAERVATERGAMRMLWHTRAGTPLAAVLTRRGYEPADITVMKRLNHGN